VASAAINWYILIVLRLENGTLQVLEGDTSSFNIEELCVETKCSCRFCSTENDGGKEDII